MVHRRLPTASSSTSHTRRTRQLAILGKSRVGFDRAQVRQRSNRFCAVHGTCLLCSVPMVENPGNFSVPVCNALTFDNALQLSTLHLGTQQTTSRRVRRRRIVDRSGSEAARSTNRAASAHALSSKVRNGRRRLDPGRMQLSHVGTGRSTHQFFPRPGTTATATGNNENTNYRRCEVTTSILPKWHL